jgi:tetratricopeptide (TPR) repeat protein
MNGRWHAAQRQLDTMATLDPATALEHRVLFSLWPLQQVPRSELVALRDSVRRWKAGPGPSNEASLTAEHGPAHPYLRLHLLGLLDARLGDSTAALRHAAELERRAGSAFAPQFVSKLGRAVRAEVARFSGRLEEALGLLEPLLGPSEVDSAASNSPFFAHEYQVLASADLLYLLGRHDEALIRYRALAANLFHSGAPAHLRMAQIYDRKGDRQKAAEHYARFLELWKDCDPELRPVVEEASRRLAAL